MMLFFLGMKTKIINDEMGANETSFHTISFPRARMDSIVDRSDIPSLLWFIYSIYIDPS